MPRPGEPYGLRHQGTTANGEHRWTVQPYIDGRRHSRSFRTPTGSRTKARQQAAHVVAEMIAEAGAQHAPTSLTKLFQQWTQRSARKWSPRTAHEHTARTKRLGALIGHIDARALTLDDIDAAWHQLRDDGMTEARILEHHRTLSAALTWAHDMERIDAVPNLRRVKPKHRPAEVSPPTNAAVRVLLDDMPDESQWARAVRLLAVTGMRRGEVCALEWDGVDGGTVAVAGAVVYTPGGGVQVKRPKSGQPRIIEIGRLANAILAAQHAELAEHAAKIDEPVPRWVFPSPDWSEPRNPDTLTRQWRRHVARHGTDVRLHDLRHFYATTALAAGVPVHAVSRQIGHEDPTTTLRIYGHALDADRARVPGIVERALSAGGTESSAP